MPRQPAAAWGDPVIRIQVDAGNVLSRQFNELERKQLPFATVQAINATAFDVRERWKDIAARVFDRATALTLNAILYKKATLAKPQAAIFIRDEAIKGTPPSKYLQAQVFGGQRAHKGIERDLQRRGILSALGHVVPGKGAQLDAFGNIPRTQINAIKSQLGAFGEQGYTANQSDVSKGRRLRRQKKQGQRNSSYFAVTKDKGGLKPGVYQRIVTGFGNGVRSILHFVQSVRYRKRFDILPAAQTIFERRFPANFDVELKKALDSSFKRAFK